MGRKATSPELKEARGNPGKRPVKKRTARLVAARRATLVRPTWLTDKVAQSVWAKLQVGEGAIQFLRNSDVHMFTRYCVYMADWIDANKQITASGGAVYETSSAHVENMKRINPWFVVRSRLEDDLVKHEEKLGLTPIDRQRILVALAAVTNLPPDDLFGGARADDDAALPGETPPAEAPAAPIGNVETVGGLRRLN